MDNDFVAMAEHICPICGCKHTHNTEVLIDKHLREIPEDKRVTGYGLCEEHQKLFDDGFVALIPVTNIPTEDTNATLNFNDADRIGGFIHLRKTVFNDIFNTEVSAEQELVFVDKEVCDMLIKMNENTKQSGNDK